MLKKIKSIVSSFIEKRLLKFADSMVKKDKKKRAKEVTDQWSSREQLRAYHKMQEMKSGLPWGLQMNLKNMDLTMPKLSKNLPYS